MAGAWAGLALMAVLVFGPAPGAWGQAGAAAPGAPAGALPAEISRQYMYAFIGAGSAVVIMALVTSYTARLNRAMRAEIRIRKQAEASLRESVERFEHIVACSGDWIWETDAGGRYTYSSAMVKDMLGYEPDDVLGRPQHEFLTATEKSRFLPKAQERQANRQRVFRERYKLVTKEGRVVIHESTAEPVVSAGGQVAGYRGVNRDVTDQVRFIQL